MFRQGSFCLRMARFNHSLGQRACGCERRGVGWIMVSSGAVMFCLSGCVLLRHRMNTTIVLARRPINAAVVGCVMSVLGRFSFGRERPGRAACVRLRIGNARQCSAAFGNQARVGTVPDQRRRLGICRGLLSFGPARCGRLMYGALRRGMVLSALVIGTMPLRRGWAEWKGAKDGR